MSTTTTNIPLTTVFTPRPSCSTDYVVYVSDTRVRQAWAYTFLVSSSSLSTNSLCEPPSISSVLRRTRQSAFSPGICPDGFTTATSSFISNTMHAYCCLDGYAIEDSLDQRYFQESASLELVECKRYITTTLGGIQVVQGASGRTKVFEVISTRSMPPPVVVQHDAISVAWMPEELGVFAEATPTLNMEVAEESLAAVRAGVQGSETTSVTRVAGAKTTGPGNAVTESDAPLSSTPSDNGNGGLSNGAKIGIGVGAAIIAVALIGGLVFFMMRRRRRDRSVKELPYGIEKDGVNNIGGIDDSPAGTGGVSDFK